MKRELMNSVKQKKSYKKIQRAVQWYEVKNEQLHYVPQEEFQKVRSKVTEQNLKK